VDDGLVYALVCKDHGNILESHEGGLAIYSSEAKALVGMMMYNKDNPDHESEVEPVKIRLKGE